ncbi:MAG: RcnB family protein [Sphingomicrobium sp.]
MRKLLFSLLLATTVATPALAQGQDHGDFRARAAARQDRQADHSQARQERAQVREDRSQAREDRSQARQDRVEVREQRMEARPQQMQDNQPPVREIVRERVVRDNRPVMNVDERADSNGWRDRAVRQEQVQRRETVRANRDNWRDQRDVRQQQIEQQADRSRVRAPAGARWDRPAPVPETARNNTRHSEWRTDWRRDHRYDWRNYRNHHRSIFRLGLYFDPFGWGYHRYNIGWRLWPSYYSSNYWLNDPYMYRLPYAPFPYKWVRYYDDALLVNVYTGQVVDVMYDFFW